MFLIKDDDIEQGICDLSSVIYYFRLTTSNVI